jgi:hypothetical protein
MLKSFLIVGLLALLVHGSALGVSNTNADANNASHPEAVDSKSDLKPPVVPSDDARGGSEHKEEKCQYNGPSWFAGFYCFFAAHEKFWVSFGTVVLVVFTTILGFATIILARATKRLVSGAEDTARRQLRAYVSVRPVGADFIYDGSSCRVTITYAVKNFGQTPAYHLVQFGEIANLMVPTAQKIQPPERPGELEEISLPPGAEVEGTVWGITEEKSLRALGSSFKKIHAVGAVYYTDAFGKERESKFCFYIENLGQILAGHTGTSGANPDGTKFWFSKQQNSAT